MRNIIYIMLMTSCIRQWDGYFVKWAKDVIWMNYVLSFRSMHMKCHEQLYVML
jgi:hypothetical protein